MAETVILGGGESGVGAAVLAHKAGLNVFLSDKGEIRDKYKQELNEKGIPYEEGRHDWDRILAASEVIKSPGIPDKVPLVQALKVAGKPVIDEVEFASRYTDATLIGITGSNGKTTTTLLTWHLLHSAGLDAALVGNVGFSFARRVAESPAPIYVLELSSFQLDGIVRFRPHISILLNITPDHLDRYDYEFSNYVRSKFRIVMNQRPEDRFLYFSEDPNVMNYLKSHEVKPARLAIHGGMIMGTRIEVVGQEYDLAPTRLLGKHNAVNALFAANVAVMMGVKPDKIRQGLESFQPAPHRMEDSGTINGVLFINDSKATNVDAVFYALQSMTVPTVWIVGGQDKGNDYGPLMPLVKEKVKAIVCLGADNSKLLAAFGPLNKPVEEANTAESAVGKALALAEPGEVVLLSPACASFDLFRNYEDRGEQFKAAVRKLMVYDGL